MMKFLKYIVPVACLSLLSACSDGIVPVTQPDDVPSDMFKVGVTINVADIAAAQTRAFSDAPDYSNLDLHIIEFELGPTPFDGSVLTNDYTEKIEEPTLNGDGDIHFKLTLYKAFEPRVLHFIAVPKGTDLNIPPGLEGAVIPTLTLTDSTPAYWQRIEFPAGYGTFDAAGEWQEDASVQTKLQHVPMICNFAKISMTNNATSSFDLEGFQILNQPKNGYIAPWDATEMKFPNFLGDDNKILTYAAIDAVYKGRTPNNEAEMTDPATASFDTEVKYIYERPVSSINNPVIIMKGRRISKGEDGTVSYVDNESKYYKLDIGYINKSDESSDDEQSEDNGDNLFYYYDILRNFAYGISIANVKAEGYDSAQEAYEGVVFNNFSFDVNTKQMLNVSNGEDMLWVNQTTFVVTNASETTISFKYRYLSDISNNGGTNANGDIKFKNLATGEAIGNITYGTTNDAEGWRTVTITTPEPTTTRKSQEFIVYNPNTGLGRTITIIVRTPWLYTNPGVWGGNYNYYQQFIDNVTAREEWNGYVSSSSEIGQPLTVRFHIDDNIPEAMFPLTFTFESNRQNIENNKVGNLLVEYGSSLFGTGATTIKYKKTVTWADYNSALTKDNETGTIVDDDNDGITSHVVRARFQTILSIGENEQTIIRVYNPYMRVQGSTNNYLDVSFKGKEGTAPDYGPDWTPPAK